MQRPNVLLIHTDQQRWDSLGVNGNPDVHTPNVDRLAAEGVNFDRYFVQSPVCMPSRASYLTGQYPSQLNILSNGVPVPEETITLPRILDQYGYVSANVGKLHFQPHANRDHRAMHPDYGFDHLEVSDEPGTYEDAYRAWVRRKAPEQLPHVSTGPSEGRRTWQELLDLDDEVTHPEKPDSTPVAEPFAASEEVTHSAFVAEQSMEFIERHQDRPFLCVAGFYPPHRISRALQMWVAPERFLNLYDRGSLTLPEFPPEIEAERDERPKYTDDALRTAMHGYYAMVSEVDHHVGRLLDHLADLGLAENTIVVFTSDHGEYLGEHLQYMKAFPAPDPVSRVPFVVRWPEGIENPGRTVSEIVEAVDLVPTLLECVGVQIPPHLQGESMRSALTDDEFAGRESALLEGGGQRMDGRTLRTDRFRYVIHQDGDEELYDLDREFGDYRDVADESGYEDALAEMRYRLLVRLNGIESPLARTWPY